MPSSQMWQWRAGCAFSGERYSTVGAAKTWRGITGGRRTEQKALVES